MRLLKLFVTPNARLTYGGGVMLVGSQIAFAFVLWLILASALLPTPSEVISSLGSLIVEQDLLRELWVSLSLCLQAMGIAIALSLLIAYATVLPFFRPLGFMVSKLRFLTLVGLSFVFVLLTHSGHSLKVSLLVAGITVFMVTGMLSILDSVTKVELNHARTLRMNEWQVVWEVIVLGKLDSVLDLIRQNFAIAWTLLTLVEGISRSEGGIGTMLLNQNKHFHLDAVFAIQGLILLVGVSLDYLFGLLKTFICPYSSLSK